MDDAAATALRAPDGVTYFAYCFGKNGIYYIRAKVMKPYSEAAKAIIAKRQGQAVSSDIVYPTVSDGLKGVQFIDACVRSSEKNAAWVTLPGD